MPEVPVMTAAAAPAPIPEHSVVRLRLAVPEEGLQAGAEGAVVFAHEGGVAYEVEFLEGRSDLCVVTLLASDIEVGAAGPEV